MTIDPLGDALFFGSAGVTFSASILANGWSTLLPGNDIAIGNLESFDATLTGPSVAFGFSIHEPSADIGAVPDSCTITCIDSTFTLTILNGISIVDSVSFNPANDVATFFGVVSDMAFTGVEVRETVGGRDNEYFGEFYAASSAAPEPTTLALLTLGLAGIGFRNRRNTPKVA